MLVELKKLIEANPLFRDKLTFPAFKASRLRTLINQSLNWQHQLCKNPRPNPDIKTLFTDHTCASKIFSLSGTNVGDISIWEVGSRERQLWLKMPPYLSIDVFGAQMDLYSVFAFPSILFRYIDNPAGELRQHLEVDAHTGGVNDIAFAHPNKQLCILHVEMTRRLRLYTFEGHEAPFIFSTAIDGKIKAWLYDSLGSRVDYDAPGLWCTTMAYSADGTRCFQNPAFSLYC
ncbi:UNVERIFIED_CONTAM: protein TPR3 [Sesamum angustifolium]|uniref:Protein TPR3 n=1 Tax=Sesamum angustifolium TaxID=2727405 RepID=A0AAW2MHT9_9LAMI